MIWSNNLVYISWVLADFQLVSALSRGPTQDQRRADRMIAFGHQNWLHHQDLRVKSSDLNSTILLQVLAGVWSRFSKPTYRCHSARSHPISLWDWQLTMELIHRSKLIHDVSLHARRSIFGDSKWTNDVRRAIGSGLGANNLCDVWSHKESFALLRNLATE